MSLCGRIVWDTYLVQNAFNATLFTQLQTTNKENDL